MTAICPTCRCLPVLEHDHRGFRYGCANRNRHHIRSGFAGHGCENWTVYYATTERVARKSWNRAVATEPGKCVCGLRLPCNDCLVGRSATSRDAGKSQWWAQRKDHHPYSNEDSRP
jgi:hypothetical protein